MPLKMSISPKIVDLQEELRQLDYKLISLRIRHDVQVLDRKIERVRRLSFCERLWGSSSPDPVKFSWENPALWSPQILPPAPVAFREEYSSEEAQ